MKVAFGTDEHTALTDAVRADLEGRGHTVVAVDDGQWVEVGHAVGDAVAGGRADSGVLFCWTGTGASIAANKVAGVRAALCTDAATAAGARTWNDANVLVMGLRLTSPGGGEGDARRLVRHRGRSRRGRGDRRARGATRVGSAP